jgi:acyl carrier protein
MPELMDLCQVERGLLPALINGISIYLTNSEVKAFQENAREERRAMNPSVALEKELKQFIITTLRLEDIFPEDIDSEQPLFNDGLGLDSIDGLELGMALSKTYKIEFRHNPEENKRYFTNIKTLVEFISEQMLQRKE